MFLGLFDEIIIKVNIPHHLVAVKKITICIESMCIPFTERKREKTILLWVCVDNDQVAPWLYCIMYRPIVSRRSFS